MTRSGARIFRLELLLCALRYATAFQQPTAGHPHHGLHRPPGGNTNNYHPNRQHHRQQHSQLQLLPDESILAQLAAAGVVGVAADPLAAKILEANPRLYTKEVVEKVEVQTTFLYGAADSLSNAARVYFVLTFVDTAIQMSGLTVPFLPSNLGEAAPTIAFAIWACLTLSKAKKTFFVQKVAGNQLGRVALYDQLIDFILVIVTFAVIVDKLDFDIGMGLQSVFAASGVGALVFSLAIKGLAEQIVGGLLLQTWDAFQVGEDIVLGDGTEGTIRKIGLVETEVSTII